MNIADDISRHARAAPWAVAIIEGDRIIHYAALERAVWRAAAWFRRQGVAPGDTVAVSMGNTALHLVVAFALARMGAVQLPLAQREARAYRETLARRYRAVALVADSDAVDAAGLTRLRADPEWLKPGQDAPEEGVRASGGGAGWQVVLTSGTTGAPKAVLQSHSAYAARRALNQGPSHFLPEDRYLALMGLDFHLGFRMCVDALWAGAAAIVGARLRNAAEMFDLADRCAVSFLFLTPSHLHEALPFLPPDRPRLPRLRLLRTAAMTVSEALRETVVRRLTPNFIVGYGINDLGCAVTQADAAAQARFPGSVGLPLPGIEVQVVDEQGRPLPSGEVGHVRIRIPDMPSGYIDNAEATAKAFRDGWFHPGDLAALSPEGALYLKGRADDMMNFDGIKIYPADIEAALLEHPAVAEAAAFALDSEHHQHVPAAAVVLRGPIDGAALAAWCREKLAGRAPQTVYVVASLPKNAMGKVLKRELAEAIAGRAQAGAAA